MGETEVSGPHQYQVPNHIPCNAWPEGLGDQVIAEPVSETVTGLALVTLM